MKVNTKSLEKSKLVESIIQFGSSLNKKDFKDVDLCVFTKKKLSLKEKLSLQRNLPENYDVNFYDDLPVNLKKEVMSKGKVIFTNNYFQLLKKMHYLDLDSLRFKNFLRDYHKRMVKAI